MGLLEFLGLSKPDSRTPDLPMKEKWPRPRIQAECCGRHDFAVGPPTGEPWFDGEKIGIDRSSPLLCCCHCGKFWGLNASGLYEPHANALPPQWAQIEMQRQAIEREIKRRADGADTRALNRGAMPRAPRPAARPVDPED